MLIFLILSLCFSYFLLLVIRINANKIKRITASIHGFRTQPSHLAKKNEGVESENRKLPIENRQSHIINDLNDEVLAWAKERKDEIEHTKKLETYRKEFLGNVSHELKTPIFNIQGYVSTLLDGGLEDTSINVQYLVRAEKSIERLISIVEDLEAITQIETGELQLDMESFDVFELIKEVFVANEMNAKSKQINLIETTTTAKGAALVYADKFRIRQVLTNLVSNSIKYGKSQGETRVQCYSAGDNVVVEVSDNGIGISKQHLPRIFERFFRVDKSRSREQGGTGLGLSIVKHIIEAHNQTLNVTSTEGMGTVFSFTLKKA